MTAAAAKSDEKQRRSCRIRVIKNYTSLIIENETFLEDLLILKFKMTRRIKSS